MSEKHLIAAGSGQGSTGGQVGEQGQGHRQSYEFVTDTSDGHVVVRDEAGICHIGFIAHVVVRLERPVMDGTEVREEEVIVFGPPDKVGGA